MEPISFVRSHLVIVGGFGGSGKSTVSRRLSAKYRIPIFDSDTFGKAATAALNGGGQIDGWAIGYPVLFSVLQENLELGLSAILDSNMGHRQSWRQVDQLKTGLPRLRCLPLVLECPFEVCEARVEQRNLGTPDKLELSQHRQKYEFLSRFEYDGLVRVNSNRNVDEVFEEVSAMVGKFLKS